MEFIYERRPAGEDAVVFPAWKEAPSAHQLDEMGELFEEIGRRQFGGGGFEDAVAQIKQIELALGVADICRFAAPPPKK